METIAVPVLGITGRGVSPPGNIHLTVPVRLQQTEHHVSSNSSQPESYACKVRPCLTAAPKGEATNPIGAHQKISQFNWI